MALKVIYVLYIVVRSFWFSLHAACGAVSLLMACVHGYLKSFDHKMAGARRSRECKRARLLSQFDDYCENFRFNARALQRTLSHPAKHTSACRNGGFVVLSMRILFYACPPEPSISNQKFE